MSVTTGVGLVSQEDKFGRIIAGDSYKNYIRLQTNDFAYNKSATKEFPQGYIARYTGTKDAAVPNSIFTCFRPNTAAVIPEYLDHLVQGNYHGRWLRRYITVGARAHGALSVSDDDLLAMPVPLPPRAVTRAEQQKIADCLGSLDDLLAAEDRKLEALRQHKQGLMRQLFPEAGETVPRLRFPDFRHGPTWDTKRIGELEPFVTSGSRGWAAHYAKSGDLFIRITNLSRDSIYLDLTDSQFVDLPTVTSEAERTRVQEHDILISVTADIGIIGYVANDVSLPAYINQHIALVRLDQTRVCSEFIAGYLASDVAQRRFTESADQGAKAGMNLDEVRRIQLMLPEREEQCRIAECIRTGQARVDTQAEWIRVLKCHKKAMLQQLFPAVESVEP
jgi:type I restriction enzyme S subunit